MSKKKPKTSVDPSLIEQALQSVETVEKDSKSDKKEKSQNAEEVYDRLVRLTADFENFRKRTLKEKADLVRYGNENLVRELLPVLDNFERAVEHTRKTEDIESIRTGVELILSQLLNALDRFGVTSRPAVGEIFDPTIHEAVSQVSSEKQPPHTVVQEHQKAYFLQDKLIRPALVTVSKGPEDVEKEEKSIETQVSDEKE